MPYIRAQTGWFSREFIWTIKNDWYILEAVTFLGNQERDRNLYAIPGLDYVAHEDVIPYTVDINEQNWFLMKIELAFFFRVQNEHQLNMNYLINF